MSLKNPVTSPGIDPGTVRLVAQRLNHYATSDPTETYSTSKIIRGAALLFWIQVFKNKWDGIKGSEVFSIDSDR